MKHLWAEKWYHNKRRIKWCCLAAWKVGWKGVRNSTSRKKSPLQSAALVWTTVLQLTFKYWGHTSVIIYILYSLSYIITIIIHILVFKKCSDPEWRMSDRPKPQITEEGKPWGLVLPHFISGRVWTQPSCFRSLTFPFQASLLSKHLFSRLSFQTITLFPV